MPTPKFEVKKVKTFRGREGHGFNADLFMDDRRVAFVMDSANGGCYRWEYANREIEQEFKDYVKTLDLKFEDGTPITFEQEDIFVSRLVDRETIGKQFKRDANKGVCAKMPGQKKGTYSIFKVPFSPAAKESILRQHPQAKVLNDRYPEGDWYETIMEG